MTEEEKRFKHAEVAGEMKAVQHQAEFAYTELHPFLLHPNNARIVALAMKICRLGIEDGNVVIDFKEAEDE